MPDGRRDRLVGLVSRSEIHAMTASGHSGPPGSNNRRRHRRAAAIPADGYGRGTQIVKPARLHMNRLQRQPDDPCQRIAVASPRTASRGSDRARRSPPHAHRWPAPPSPGPALRSPARRSPAGHRPRRAHHTGLLCPVRRLSSWVILYPQTPRGSKTLRTCREISVLTRLLSSSIMIMTQNYSLHHCWRDRDVVGPSKSTRLYPHLQPAARLLHRVERR